MKKSRSVLMKAACLSIALLGSTAVVAVVAMPDAAYAKNDKKQDKAKKAKKAKKEKSHKAKDRSKKAARAEKPANHPSRLGALNAANASENALANASPNSRVGKIAVYRDLVLQGEELNEVVSLPLSEANSALVELEANKPAREEAEVVALLEEANSAEPVDTALTSELALELETIRDYSEKHVELTTAIADYELQLSDQEAAERAALEAAANKPVTDETELAVKELLGL